MKNRIPETGDRGPWSWSTMLAAMVFSVFGLPYPVSGSWQCPDGSPPPCRGAAAQRPSGKSLAVLPFESVGGDTANAYCAEGLSDELTSALSHVEGLRVTASRSAFASAAGRVDVRRVGRVLNVGTVLEGRVRRSGTRMRVVATLSNATTGVLMWSNSYERDLSDVFTVQAEIARQIVAALQVRLTGTPATATNEWGTSDLEAHDLYLRGVFFYHRRGPGLARATAYFEQAIARDAAFARAHAMLAISLFASEYYIALDPALVLRRSRASAERAVGLDNNLSEAHLAMSIVHIQALEWRLAETEARRAIALDPNAVEAVYRLGFILLTTGYLPEAMAEFQKARVIDPLYPLIPSYLGWCYGIQGQPDSAIAMARRAMELDSTLVSSHTLITYTYFEIRHRDEAVAYARRFLPALTDGRRIGMMAGVLGWGGQPAEAQAVIDRLLAMPADGPQRNAGLAYAYLGIGDTTRALDAMERAVVTDGVLLLSTVPYSKNYDAVRSSPRFIAVLRRLNLDPARFVVAR